MREPADLDALAFRHDQSFAKSIGLLRSSVAVTFGIGYFRPVAQLNSTRALGLLHAAVRECRLVGRIGRAAFGAHQEAFLVRDFVDARLDRLVRHRDREAAALAHRAQDEKIADRLRHADARRDGVRILEARRVLFALLTGAHHRRAAFGLHRDHARPLRADEADRLELGERLPHADQAGAAAGRVEDDVGQLPAELLGELQPHRLLAFDPVRLLQRGGVEPAGRFACPARPACRNRRSAR